MINLIFDQKKQKMKRSNWYSLSTLDVANVFPSSRLAVCTKNPSYPLEMAASVSQPIIHAQVFLLLLLRMYDCAMCVV